MGRVGDNRVTKVVIVGGGTAGGMAAAALSRMMGHLSIRLVESDAIGTVGVGEATIPAIRLFNALIDLDEDEFIRETQGTFKLGIEFRDWGRIGDAYMHAFGQIGRSLGILQFPQYWLRGRREGVAGPLADYSLTETAARRNRFARLPGFRTRASTASPMPFSSTRRSMPRICAGSPSAQAPGAPKAG